MARRQLRDGNAAALLELRRRVAVKLHPRIAAARKDGARV
jgi:hypothetical protein